MLSRIDEIIYPSRCEVIELHDLNRFIYPIYKNGSTVLTQCLKYKFKTIVNEQIKKAPEIEIILRNPVERFISGINSFIYSLKEENPNLDTDTIIYFVENYLFLNRHYAPQLSWLINLSKYINKNTKLKFFGMNELDNLTNKLDHPEIKILSAEKIEQLKESVQKVHGNFISIWHNSSFDPSLGWEDWEQVYESLFE